ncbi:hypothetical protein Gpo141_00011828 [Globisporangium polare]
MLNLSIHSAYTLVAVVALICVCMLAFKSKNTHKRIVAGESKLNSFILAGLQPLLDRYTPTWWTNGHIQIVLTFLVPQASIKYRREVLQLRDGGHTSLDWAIESSGPASKHGKPLQEDSPIVVVMHGLTGCSDAMRSLCAEALFHGYRPVVFNKRGHGSMKLATPKLQEFACIQDLNQGIDRIKKTFPSAKLYGVGFSAGSGLLCSYLGKTGDASRLDAGVLVSPGYDAFDLFCRGRIHKAYDYLMSFALKQFLLGHKEQLEAVIDVSHALESTSIRDFDERVFMKMHGYKDLESYWVNNNPMHTIKNIQRPALCISALDDPVCKGETVRHDWFEGNPIGMLVETGKGSHCAFYEGHFVMKSWALEAAMEFLDRVQQFQQIEALDATEEIVRAELA